MARIITIASTKGGVGKTTLAANLGAALADLNQRVLLVDTDKQQSLSKFFPIPILADLGLLEMIQSGSTSHCISHTNIKNLDIVVNNDPEEKLKSWVAESPVSRMLYLGAALSNISHLYDVILIDTVGTRGTGELQEMAIRAADLWISPISGDWLAAKELPNTINLLQKLEPPPGIIIGNKPIPPLSVVLWGIKRTSDNQWVVSNFQNEQGELFIEYSRLAKGKFNILATVIPAVEAYNKAVGLGVPIHRYEPKREGPTPSGAESMLSLVHELFTHLKSLTFDMQGKHRK